MQKLTIGHQYKIGDKVRIKHFSVRMNPPDGYNFLFSTFMIKYSGEVLKIINVVPYRNKLTYKMECDGHYYWEEWMFDYIAEDVNDKVFDVLLGKNKGEQ